MPPPPFAQTTALRTDPPPPVKWRFLPKSAAAPDRTGFRTPRDHGLYPEATHPDGEKAGTSATSPGAPSGLNCSVANHGLVHGPAAGQTAGSCP